MNLQAAALAYLAAPSPRTELRFVEAVEPKVRIVCRIALKASPTEDQLQEARVAAVAVLRAYDPARGLKVITMVDRAIRHTLYREREGRIRVPEYMQTLMRKYARVTNRYLIEQEREPTDLERCREIILNGKPLTLDQLETLRATMRATAPWALGLEAVDASYRIENEACEQIDVRKALGNLKRQNKAAYTVAKLHLLEGKALGLISAMNRTSNERTKELLAIACAFLRKKLADYQTLMPPE